MGKKPYMAEANSPEAPVAGTHGSRRTAALHIILGLALLFLAGTLLIHLVEELRQTGLGFPVFVSLLGFILFCILGVMLLGSELRHIFKNLAEKSRSRRAADHGQQSL